MAFLPDSSTFVNPGLDDPLAGIVATFTQWGNVWAWQVIYTVPSTDNYTYSHVEVTSEGPEVTTWLDRPW